MRNASRADPFLSRLAVRRARALRFMKQGGSPDDTQGSASDRFHRVSLLLSFAGIRPGAAQSSYERHARSVFTFRPFSLFEVARFGKTPGRSVQLTGPFMANAGTRSGR
jgi:hypothetical protein